MNLVDSLLSPLLEQSRLSLLAKITGTSEAALRTTLSGLVPAFLGILTTLFRGGSSGLVWQAVRQAEEELDSDRLQTLLEVGRLLYLVESGQLVLDAILGQPRLKTITDVLQRNLNSTPETGALLLPLLTPYLLGMLSRQLNTPPWSYNMNSLSMLLESQRRNVLQAIPDEVITPLAGIAGLESLPQMKKNSLGVIEVVPPTSALSTVLVGVLIVGVAAVVILGSSRLRTTASAPTYNQPQSPTASRTEGCHSQ